MNNNGIFFDKVFNKILNIAFKKGQPKSYYKFIKWLNSKAIDYDFNLKDEKELIELQQWEQREQYDFDYRQQWAINNGFNI